MSLVEKTKGNFKYVIGNFFDINRKSIPAFLFVTFLIAITNILGAFVNYCMGGLVDSITAKDTEKFKSILLCILVIQVLYLIIRYVSNYSANKVSEISIKRIRLHTYDCIMNGSMKWVDDVKVGDVISRVNSDLESMVNVINNILSWEIPNIFMFIVGLISCCILNWKLTCVSVIAFPILGRIQMKIGNPITNYTTFRAKAEGKAMAKFIDLLGGHAVAKVFNGKQLENSYKKEVDEAAKWEVKSAKLQFGLYPIQALISFVPFVLMYGMAVYLIKQEELTIGGMLTFTLMFLFVSNPLNSLAGQIQFIYDAIGLSSRIFELWSIEPEGEGGLAMTKKTEVPIEFSNVSFSYDTGEEEKSRKILDGITFTIEKGKMVALVGNSGEGKSTIIKLLLRFYEGYSGDIKVFGNLLNDWNVKKLRECIAYVGQDSFLFPDSIFNNVKLGNKNATDEKILHVIHELGLDDLDIYAPIGERGVKISGGQKQRICIARALLKDASLLLLDEPTSALDTESEYYVNHALKTLLDGKTCVIVAHRLSAIREVEQILCLQDGRIGESGTINELIQRKGIVYNLFSKQIGGGVEK